MPVKRVVSILIPYKESNGAVLVFMQKRGMDMERAPGLFGFFGGGAEPGETPAQTLEREIKEELDFTPVGYKHYGTYNFPHSDVNVFTLKVGDDFEKDITVFEGEYGKFFSEKQILGTQDTISTDQIILRDFFAETN